MGKISRIACFVALISGISYFMNTYRDNAIQEADQMMLDARLILNERGGVRLDEDVIQYLTVDGETLPLVSAINKAGFKTEIAKLLEDGKLTIYEFDDIRRIIQNAAYISKCGELKPNTTTIDLHTGCRS